MNPNIRANEIVAMFQRYLSTDDRSEIEALTLQELRSADEQLGQRDVGSDFRIAIGHQVKELELKEDRRYASKVRAWNLAAGFIAGVAVGVVVGWLLAL